jgi:hypothetical protein
MHLLNEVNYCSNIINQFKVRYLISLRYKEKALLQQQQGFFVLSNPKRITRPKGA